jgi:hypothetical protein
MGRRRLGRELAQERRHSEERLSRRRISSMLPRQDHCDEGAVTVSGAYIGRIKPQSR